MSSGKDSAPLVGLALAGLMALGLVAAVLSNSGDGSSPQGSAEPTSTVERPAQGERITPGVAPRERLTLSNEAQHTAPPSPERANLAKALSQLRAQRMANTYEMGAKQGPAALTGDSPGTAEPPPAEQPAPTGTVGPEAVKAAIQAVLPDVKHCYESGLKVKPGSEGVVKVAFTLVASDGGGSVSRAEILESGLNNPLTDACMLDAVAKAHFPLPTGGNGQVQVTYPFRFSQTPQQ